jgi:hypothetical protein
MSSINEHDHKNRKIRALTVAYNKYINVYVTDYSYNISKYEDDLTVRIQVVESIEPVNVAGGHGWVVWFEILQDHALELVSPHYVVKVVYW